MSTKRLPVRTVIFDLDGTILDIRQRHYSCYRNILESEGYEALDQASYWRLKRRRASHAETLRKTAAEGIEATYLARWRKAIELPGALARDRLKPGARSILKRLHSRGVTIGLSTMRQNRPSVMQQLRSLGIDSYFDFVVVSKGKAGGAGKANAVRRVVGRFSPRETLWIGDTEADADAAADLRCRLVLVTHGLRNAGALRRIEAGPVVFGLPALRRWLL